MKESILALFLFVSGSCYSQDVSGLFQSQIEAYNNQDVDAMVENLHPEFKWFYIADDKAMVETDGPQAFRTSMTAYYKNFTSVKSEMSNVSVLDNKVSFMETVTYETANGKSGTSKALGMYTFKDGKLYRAWYF